jgi:putative transposase
MTKNTKQNKSINKFDPSLLDALMKDYNPSKPEELIGKDGLLNDLKKALIERALSTELDIHLGYKKNQPSINDGDNYRNGSGTKTIITDEDKISINTPRDRSGTFEPQIIKKGQRRFNGFDQKIISMYARGMTVSDIQDHLQ